MQTTIVITTAIEHPETFTPDEVKLMIGESLERGFSKFSTEGLWMSSIVAEILSKPQLI